MTESTARYRRCSVRGAKAPLAGYQKIAYGRMCVHGKYQAVVVISNSPTQLHHGHSGMAAVTDDMVLGIHPDH